MSELIIESEQEISQLPGTTERTPNPIVRMRKLANPETRGRVRPRTAEILLASMKQCCQANPDCTYWRECLELWNTISNPNVIPLNKGETLVDPTKGKVMPGAWMAASCSRIVEYERRN